VTGILSAFTTGGSANASVSITNQNVFKSGRNTQTASYSIANDGKVKNQAGAILEAWLQGSGGVVANYEVRATLDSGTLTSGTTGSWLNCSTTRTWSLTNSASDNSTIYAALTIEIRLAATGVVQDSASVTLAAESTDFDIGGGGGHQ